MKVALAIIGTLVAALGALFLVFKLVTPKTSAATSVAAAKPPPAVAPPSATTDRTAQRIGAIGGLVGAVAGLAGNVGLKL